ncbi:MAG: hypothetical protein Q9175_006731 [Cornicularia normoerica]
MAEHLPMILVRGTKKSGPKARPATAADIYTEASQQSVADFDQLKNKKSTDIRNQHFATADMIGLKRLYQWIKSIISGLRDEKDVLHAPHSLLSHRCIHAPNPGKKDFGDTLHPISSSPMRTIRQAKRSVSTNGRGSERTKIDPTIQSIVQEEMRGNGIHYGLGQHIGQVGRPNEVTYLIILYILQLFWNTTLPAIKISILLFYRRLFPVRRLLVASSIIGAIVFGWYIAIQITAIVQCLPIHYYWRRVGHGRCIQTTNFYIILASLNLATDVAVLVLPIPFIWHLQIRKSKKLSLSVVFLLGSLVCVTSVIRLQTLTEIDTGDITWSNVYPGLWTAIEALLGIVAACLPSLGPVLHKIIGHPLSTTNDTTAKSQHTFAHSKTLFGDADMDDFARILESGPLGRDEAVIINAITDRSSVSFETKGTGTSHEMQRLKKDGSEAKKEGGIMVRKDIKQDVEREVE